MCSQHSWEAVTFDAPGKAATIAIFGAASNRRGNPTFFAMKTPFAYLSATQALEKDPLVCRRGEQFDLDYLVTLYPEVKTVEALTQRARQWISRPPKQ